MIYAEASFFDGVPVAHCAAREEHLRLLRIRTTAIQLARRANRRVQQERRA